MEAAADSTYVSKRILEQYKKERDHRIEQKKQQQLAAASGKTFSEDKLIVEKPSQAQASVLEEVKEEVEEMKNEEVKAESLPGQANPPQSSSAPVFGKIASFLGFGSKKEAKNQEEEMDHEEYEARNNSCSSLDEDDLEGGLNLSDEEQDARGQVRESNIRQRVCAPKQKVRKFRQEFDTNVTQVSLRTLENKGQVATGDPFLCERCQGVFNQFSNLRHAEDGNQYWDCEFCNNVNEVMIDDEEKPQSTEVTYLLEASAQVQDRKMGGQDISVVFCLDVSGSMCVTQPVEGKHNIKGSQLDKLQAEMRQFGDGSDQFMSAGDRNMTYVSRIQCVKAAIDSQVSDMANGAAQRKVGIVAFNHEVQVIGDGTKDSQTISGDKLNNFDYLKENGKAQSAERLTKPICETKDALKAKLEAIEETGPTALGPAVLTSVAMATQGAAGSCVVICTDGLANVGLGAFDDCITEAEQVAADSFYTQIGQIAQQAGITINVVSIEGDECNIDSLSKLAELTGGNVERVNPTTLTQNFANMLALPVIASNVEAKVKLHQGLQFRNELADNLSTDKSLLTRKFGNVTVESIFTFEYGLKPLDVLLEMEEIDMTQVTSFPFQTQIVYTALDGSKCLRVISKQQKMSTERDQLEKKADYDMLSYNAIQKGSAMARGGDIRQAQAIVKNFKRKMHKNIKTEEHTDQFRNYSEQVNNVYSGMNQMSAQIQQQQCSMAYQPQPQQQMQMLQPQPQQQMQMLQQQKDMLQQCDSQLDNLDEIASVQNNMSYGAVDYASEVQPQQQMQYMQMEDNMSFGAAAQQQPPMMMPPGASQVIMPQQAQVRMNDNLSCQLAQMSSSNQSMQFRFTPQRVPGQQQQQQQQPQQQQQQPQNPFGNLE